MLLSYTSSASTIGSRDYEVNRLTASFERRGVSKHTARAWALMNGATTWDAAGFFSTSAETIERVYGHHSPDHQATAVKAVERR